MVKSKRGGSLSVLCLSFQLWTCGRVVCEVIHVWKLVRLGCQAISRSKGHREVKGWPVT